MSQRVRMVLAGGSATVRQLADVLGLKVREVRLAMNQLKARGDVWVRSRDRRYGEAHYALTEQGKESVKSRRFTL